MLDLFGEEIKGKENHRDWTGNQRGVFSVKEVWKPMYNEVDLFGNIVQAKKSKDWMGTPKAMFKTLGASNHCNHNRQAEDFYATEPRAVELLCDLETFSHNIWEPCCGCGHISEVLKSRGYLVKSTDLIDRGYGEGNINFLSPEIREFDGSIVTNPPYRYAQEIVEKALSIIPIGRKVAMFLKVLFLEGKGRKSLFAKQPPIRVWISSSRLKCAMNGEFDAMGGSAVAYAWFVWEKGFHGDPIIKWFN